MDLVTFTLQSLNSNSINNLDCLCFLSSSLSDFDSYKDYSEEIQRLKLRQENDANQSEIVVDLHNNKLILFKSVGSMLHDTDDVRIFFENGSKLMTRAISAGKTNVAFFCNINNNANRKNVLENEFQSYKQTAIAGALESTYINLETRERPEYKNKQINIFTNEVSEKELTRLQIQEEAAVIARDMGGSDPERMAPPKMQEYSEKIFNNMDNIKLTVISDQDYIAKEFPAFQCVNRACLNVPRHQGRILILEYKSDDGQPKEHLGFVGKGVTYDTGGADIKAGGHMAGMHRDKCGACNIIGLMYAIGKLAPKNLNVTATACCIRNSVGSEAYVADEIFKSRGGKYVRVCNTDAEGRMAMVDLLCLTKEKALTENWINPKLFTVATLTGHSCIAFDEAYTACLDNGPAQRAGMSQRLIKAGHLVADPFELSTIRREDYKASTAKDGYADCLQSGMGASTRTPRGHQQPAAFMILASGLGNHGVNSEKPLCYTHLDIAPSAGPYPGLPTGAPIRALLKCFADE